MKDWIKWGLIGGIWGLITAYYGLLTEQSQCTYFPPLTFFDCYQEAIKPVIPYFSKLPIFVAIPVFVIPYIALIALIFYALHMIYQKTKKEVV